MRVLAVVVVASALLVLPSTPVAANTTVKVDGNDVVITVAVDCVGCKGKKTPDGTDLAKYWEKTVEDAWNAAFDKYPYCSKYKFKLKVDIKARRDNFTATKGRHRILVGEPGSGLAQTGWDGVYEPTPGGDPGQRSPDGTRYYQNDGDGAMGADATPTVIIHEFGHVIGLGDDRDSQGNALPNRGPTIMIGGARLPDGTVVTPDTKLKIDKNLIDRIGDQLVNLGKVTCGQVWKGTIHHTVTSSTSSGGPCPNPVIVDGKVQLIVKPNGAVVGTYDLTGCGVSEPHAVFPGRATERQFLFPALIVQTNGEPIPKTRDGRARARLTNLQGTTTWVTDWDLKCVEHCDEPVA